jgi:hypothetical protein
MSRGGGGGGSKRPTENGWGKKGKERKGKERKGKARAGEERKDAPRIIKLFETVSEHVLLLVLIDVSASFLEHVVLVERPFKQLPQQSNERKIDPRQLLSFLSLSLSSPLDLDWGQERQARNCKGRLVVG